MRQADAAGACVLASVLDAGFDRPENCLSLRMRRAVVLFDEDEVIEFVKMIEHFRREAEEGYWEERRKRSQWAEALRRRSVRQARREAERLLTQIKDVEEAL